jgi:hypothetical protein
VFHFRSGHFHALHVRFYQAKLPNLKLKTRPKTTSRFSPVRYHAQLLKLFMTPVRYIYSDEVPLSYFISYWRQPYSFLGWVLNSKLGHIGRYFMVRVCRTYDIWKLGPCFVLSAKMCPWLANVQRNRTRKCLFNLWYVLKALEKFP